jgi:hypothetical protein
VIERSRGNEIWQEAVWQREPEKDNPPRACPDRSYTKELGEALSSAGTGRSKESTSAQNSENPVFLLWLGIGNLGIYIIDREKSKWYRF